MNIMGIGGSIHDFSSCLIGNDDFVVAIEDERITKVRYGIGKNPKCIPSMQYCLDSVGAKISDIDLIVTNDDNAFLEEYSPLCNCNLVKVNHHVAHASSSFFSSDFEHAAILVIDGAGSLCSCDANSSERETTSLFKGVGNHLRLLGRFTGNLNGENPFTQHEALTSNSVGEFYRAVAECLELGWLTGPGKMMGLASYGSPVYVEYMMENIKVLSEGRYHININGREGLLERVFLLRHQEHQRKPNDKFAVDADIAASGQFIYERLLFHILNFLYTETREDNLCLAGGAILNSIANGKILENTPFKNVNITFAPGDDGLSIGTALLARSWSEPNSRCFRKKLPPYLGREYRNDEICEALNRRKDISFVKSNDVCTDTAKFIANGKVVGWFQGRSEFGPRALGNRSILADPRDASTRDHINKNVKFREWYRPLAPSVLEDKRLDFFVAEHASYVMQVVGKVRNSYKIAAVSHVDDSARLQSVSKNSNELYYRLIERFYELTGIPVLLNTSYNINGKPIVETPDDAIDAFVNSNIDVLAMSDYIVQRI